MQSSVTIGLAHWLYLAGVFSIVITMIFRANVVVPSILSTFVLMLALSGSVVGGIGGIFMASFVAAQELFNIFLVIAFMTALLNSLKILRSDVRMVEPFRAVMKNGHLAYFVLAAITYLISLFFWPTPAIPLVCAILLPAAIMAGLPPIAGAMAVAIAGQGMALSSDYVIGVAPGISARAAGAAVSAIVVADRALVLSLITGGIALVLGYLTIRHLICPANPALLDRWHEAASSGVVSTQEFGTFHKAEMVHWIDKNPDSANMANKNTAAFGPRGPFAKWSRLFAILTPLTFLGVVLVMVLPKLGTGLPELKGGDAAALVGGVAALLMMLATLAAEGPRKMLDVCPDHITDGLVFAFKAMGSVLPIAGFFFLGAGETAAHILGVPADKAPSLLFELVQAGQHLIPNNGVLVAFGVLIVALVVIGSLWIMSHMNHNMMPMEQIMQMQR